MWLIYMFLGELKMTFVVLWVSGGVGVGVGAFCNSFATLRLTKMMIMGRLIIFRLMDGLGVRVVGKVIL